MRSVGDLAIQYSMSSAAASSKLVIRSSDLEMRSSIMVCFRRDMIIPRYGR